jgi:hypothetical protein
VDISPGDYTLLRTSEIVIARVHDEIHDADHDAPDDDQQEPTDQSLIVHLHHQREVSDVPTELDVLFIVHS